MKKSFITITTLLVLMSALIALSGCKPDEMKVFNNNVGNDMPTAVPTAKINSGMSAHELYVAGMSNYYGAKYVGSYQTGDITTSTFAGSTVQALTIRKINDGGTIYMDNTSYTTKKIMGISIQLIDQAVVEPSGAARYRASKKCDMVDGELVAKTWGATNHYNNLNAMLAEKANNPALMHMYVINKDTIMSTSEPQYDKKTKQFSFNLDINAAPASVNYDRVVKDQLANNGFSNASVDYKSLSLEVVMWENGFIRSINVNETYSIKAGVISGNVSAAAKINFTYLAKEMPVSNYIKF